MKFLKLQLLLLGLLTLSSCSETVPVPKQKAYPRLYFPAKSYIRFAPEGCPYSFDMPVYGRAQSDSLYLGRPLEEDCWYNLYFDSLNASINLTYKAIENDVTLSRLTDDAYRLSFKHSKKADYIDETIIKNQQGLSGVIYEVGGNAASSVQFFLTDSNRHFVRGALYFNSEPNIDSMRPVIAFVRKDLDRMIQTFRMQ